jgi:large subunit ribosomal protein L23
MSKTLFLKPRLSEKAYAMSSALNTYVFDVPKSATKLTIANAVRDQYGVVALKVRVANVSGKTQRSYNKASRRYVTGQRSNIRKAYITLKEGDKLPIFAAVEEAKPEKESK